MPVDIDKLHQSLLTIHHSVETMVSEVVHLKKEMLAQNKELED